MSDRILAMWVASLIEMVRLRGGLRSNDSWEPGRKLKLLVAGYNGAKNTGEEVRVEEIVRQFRHILGDKNVELSVLTLNPEFSQGYYGNAMQVQLPFIFPPFLYSEAPRYDGVIASCGAMFMSKFSNVPSFMMIEALAIASSQRKLSIAYGGEAGEMDPVLAGMCQRYCKQTTMIIRNEESRAALEKLGIGSQVGTDTAWTFEPSGAASAHKALRSAGWDGVQPILALCPNNPFWWPVRPSLVKASAWALMRAYGRSHYQSIYFHKSGAAVDSAYDRYIEAIAGACAAFRKERGVFLILVGMERLDLDPCRRIAERVNGLPIFASEECSAFQLVGLLRCSQFIVSSRYHALVTSMPGLVPSAGVSMDGRIRNLMQERGHSDLVVDSDDPQLKGKLLDVLNKMTREGEGISDAIGRTVAKNLKAMARMGQYLEQDVRRVYPNFPFRKRTLVWEDYLPPLGSDLRALVEKYEQGRGTME